MRSTRSHLKELEQEINGSAYQTLLRKLQQHNLIFRNFREWSEVTAIVRSGSSRDPHKDEVLRPIFRAHGENNDPRWRTLLMVMFWPALEAIHVQKRSWDPDPDERWQNIVWAFLRVICRIDLEQRPERLAQKIFNDTVYYLREECRRSWTRAKREFPTDPDKLGAGAVGDEIDIAGIELREEYEIEIGHLRGHLGAGRITDADFLLLVGTRLYGQSVAEYARGAGLDYQVAKKRRQRAEAAIRRFEKEMS